jgi:RNA polymerase sigma-70 factor (ECF subfamily)
MAPTAEPPDGPSAGMSICPPWFEDLYKRNNNVLHRVLLPRCGPTMVDDIRQETFLRALKNLSTLQRLHEYQQRVWLLTTARRLAIDSSRTINREAATPISDVAAPNDQYEQVDEADKVRRALSRLPIEQQEVLALRYIADLQVKEIADILDLTQTAVTTRLHRARSAFKRAYGQGGTR